MTFSTKHQPHSSPGSNDRMIGCPERLKCAVACLFFELSQQPTWPQVMHRRRWTHESPTRRQSSQPAAPAVTSRIWSRWLHPLIASQPTTQGLESVSYT